MPVTNVGTMPGKEVVQAYVSVPWGKLDQPYQTLAGFGKTGELLSGETQSVTVIFGIESLASYDTEVTVYILEAGIILFGCPADYKSVMKALRGKDKEFSLTRSEIVDCAEHIVDVTLRLT